jgi:hypothetical protein
MAPRRNSRRDRVRLKEAELEIDSDTIPDSAVAGLMESWIVPTIVEKAIQSMIASGTISSPLQNRGFDTYNYLGSGDCSGEEESEGRAPAKARATEADPTASTHVDARGVQGADRTSDAAELDGQ